MEAARHYPHNADAGFDSTFNSQPAPAIPLSQLLSRTALPGLSQLYDGGLLPGNSSPGSNYPISQVSAAPRAKGLPGLPLPPLEPLPRLATAGLTVLPPLSQFEANGPGGRGLGSPSSVDGVGTQVGAAGADQPGARSSDGTLLLRAPLRSTLVATAKPLRGAAADEPPFALPYVEAVTPSTARLSSDPFRVLSPVELSAPCFTTSTAASLALPAPSKPSGGLHAAATPAAAGAATTTAAPCAPSAVKARRPPPGSSASPTLSTPYPNLFAQHPPGSAASSQQPSPLAPPYPPPALLSATASALSTALSEPASSTRAA